MPAYTFHTLSPADFEELCRDLLSVDRALRLQSFPPGPDGGVDLLHASQDGDTVVQCKHFWKSGFAALRSELQRVERLKVKRLSPQRYILCTSVGLTRKNKRQLLDVLKPYCRGTDDVIGCDDLNALLRENPKVEKCHYKLWLTSTAVVERILRNGLAVWNDMERTEIERKLCLYVQTGAFDKAMEIVAHHRYVIISGIPGIGKTTLAQMLVTHFLNQDFELVAARDDVQQALDDFDATRKQVIYYDDFLGRSSLGERLVKNEEHGLFRLLSEATQSKNKIAILTTREYVLQEAREKCDVLAGPELEVAKCIVEVASYTRARRARILYNHLVFSRLPPAYVDALIQDRAYRRIIDHANYSPRVVEWMTTAIGVAGVTPTDYPAVFLSNLDNPARLWRHAFEQEITEDARRVLLILATLTERVDMDDLEAAWDAAGPGGMPAGPGEQRLRFTSVMRQLDGCFVQTQRLGKDTAVSFHNASIRDFLLHRIGSDLRLLRELLERAAYFEQVATLVRLDSKGRVTKGPSGQVADGPELRGAIERTLRSTSPSLFRVPRSGGEAKFYWRQKKSPGDRISQIVRWATELRSDALLEFAADLTVRLDADQAIDERDALTFTPLLDALMDAPNVSAEKREAVLRALLERIDDRLNESASVQDWATWGGFVTKHRGNVELPDWEGIEDRARQFCESEAENVLSSARSSDDIDSGRDELASVGDAWKIDVSRQLEWLEEVADERRLREPDLDDLPRNPPSADAAPADDADSEIDRLFASLQSRLD